MLRKKPSEVRAVNRIATLMRDHPALFQGRPFEISGPFVGAGWLSIADAMCSDIERILGAEATRFRAIQCKEKWGSWRFYWSLEAAPGEDPERDSAFTLDMLGTLETGGAPIGAGLEASPTPLGVRLELLPSGELRQAVHARVRLAERATEATCMWCGRPASHWTTGWVHVACDRHRRIGAVTLEEAYRRHAERRSKTKRDDDGT